VIDLCGGRGFLNAVEVDGAVEDESVGTGILVQIEFEVLLSSSSIIEGRWELEPM
jgi:hypothetical protein